VNRRSRHRLPSLLALCTAWLVVLSPAATVPVAAAEELRITAATTYALDPEAGAVHVTIDLSVANLKPNRVQGNQIISYYWDSLAFGIQEEAASIRATGSGRALAVSREPEDGYVSLEIRLASRLDYRETQRLRIQYDLPGGAPRSQSFIRVGEAFASFYAWAWGDPGRSSVTIRIPEGFDETISGADMTRASQDGAITLTAASIDDPQEWFVSVDAERPSRLTRVPLELLAGARIAIHSWPEDEEWRTKVRDLMEDGLPVLQSFVGLDWPVSGELGVYEVHTPLLEGYAGVYYTDRDRIEIGEDLDDLTILHEASHAWFNDDLFAERWITEGMADEFAALVLIDLDRTATGPERPDPDDRAGVPLSGWVHPGRITDEATDDRESYGYNTSWYVVSELIEEIGIDGMRDVIAAADANLTAYDGAGDPETVAARDTWQRFLDLLVEVGGSSQAEDLFRAWVIQPELEDLLVDRAEAREAYADLLEAGAGWEAPWSVRSKLGAWEFGRVDEAMAEAMGVLEDRDALEARAETLGVERSDRLETAYDAASVDMDDAEAVIAEEAESLDALEATKAALERERDALVTLGLWNEVQPETHWATATAAFATDDHDTAVAEAERAQAIIDGAAAVGRDRATSAAAGAGAGVLVVGGTLLMVQRRRRGRRAQATAMGPGPLVAAPQGVADEARPYATLPAQPEAPEPPAEPRAEPVPEPPAPDQGGSDPP
jgi:hypothetical protein